MTGDFVLVKPTMCSDLGALPERPVSIHTFITIVFTERAYLFPVFIYKLKVFSFTALGDNLKTSRRPQKS